MDINNARFRFYFSIATVSMFFASFLFLFIYLPNTLSQVNVSIWDGSSVATQFSSGNGSIDDPYTINDASEFALLFKLLNSEDNMSYYSSYYELNTSIDMNNNDFNFLTSNSEFKGNINGKGYSIYNFNITEYYNYENNYTLSLFNKLNGAVINYLNISDVDIVVNGIDNSEALVNVNLLGTDVINSTISNISFNNIKIEGTYTGNVNSSLLFNNDLGNNTINNINIDFTSTYDSKGIFNNYLDSNISNIMHTNNDLVLVSDLNILNNYTYSKNEDSINFSDLDTALMNFNNNSNLDWIVEGNKLIVECEVLNDFGNFSISLLALNDDSPISLFAAPVSVMTQPSVITEHSSGSSNNTLYINDFIRDKNYYTGLNYTKIYNVNYLPNSYTGYFNDDYLVKSEIIYDGRDINNSSVVGHVSPSESENKYVYYKYYPLERDSSGNLLTDSYGNNYIRIELIDNPFSARPNNKGFIGWGCQDESVTISYDNRTYTRYALVSVGTTRSISLTFNAIWGNANIQTGGTNSIDNLDNAGMKAMYHTVTISEDEEEEYQCNPHFNQTVRALNNNSSSNVNNRGTISAGSYYVISNNANNIGNGATVYYAANRTTCSVSGGNKCYIFGTTTINSGTTYTSQTRILVPSGTNTFVLRNNSSDFSNLISYDTCTRINTVTHDELRSNFTDNDKTIGYFYFVGSNYSNNGLYYDNLGRVCSSSNNCGSNAYKLIQYNDNLLNSDGTSISIMSNGTLENSNVNNYYYLVTRDMNILVNTSSGTSLANYMSGKPYTLTSTYNGSNITNNYINGNVNAILSSDMVIENIKVNGVGGSAGNETVGTAGSLSANSHNLKIGRGVFYSATNGTVTKTNKVFNGIYGISSGYSGSAANPDRFKVIVESGAYNYLLGGSPAAITGTTTFYINANYIYGSDYDRVKGENGNLYVYFNALASTRDNYNYGNDKNLYSSLMNIKSGNYGRTNGGAYSNENAWGVYVGGRSNTHYSNSLRMLLVEGGNINVINGGPCVENNLSSVTTALYMTGGTVRQIYGGAGTTTTYGSRLVSVTGGTVLSSVFGGSNAYNSGSEGLLTGSTLVYIGGNAVIGNDDDISNGTKLFNVTSGNVFGAGNGADNGTTAGIVTNSHVIINGGTIKNSVYAGGNHGSVGTNTSSDNTTAVIDIYAGSIGNSVFGAGESVGGGYNRSQTSSMNYILTEDYYTDVNFATTSQKSVSVTETQESSGRVTGPTVTNSSNDGYIPAGAYLTNGNQVASRTLVGASTPTVEQFGPTTTTNTTRENRGFWIFSDYYTITTTTTETGYRVEYASNFVTSGTRYDSTKTYYKLENGHFVQVTPTYETDGEVTNTYTHDITINFNGGTVTNSIYGGSNSAGNVYGNVDINLNKGTATSVYGGGCGVSGNNIAVQVLGNIKIDSNPNSDNDLVLTNVYGGSALGSVNTYGTCKVTIDGGKITNVFGGGEGNSTTAPNCYGKLTTTINSGEVTNVFGGNNLAGVPSSDVYVVLNGGNVANCYGGGNKSAVTNTNVSVNNSANVGYLFGGSNESGNVNSTLINLNGGTLKHVYGGNNIGGTVNSTLINALGGSVTNETHTGEIYGGGRQAVTTNTHVVYNGTFADIIYGGGESAGITDLALVDLVNGTASYVYGGSNITGDVNQTTINGSNGTYSYIYGGGKKATTANTLVNLNGVNSTNVFGGGESADITGKTIVNVNNGTIDNVYGGSNITGNVLTTNVNYNYGISSNVFGGNNQGGTTNISNVEINDGYITNLYGGGNEVGINTTKVHLNGGTITNLYGGSNETGDVNVSNIYTNKPALSVDVSANSRATEAWQNTTYGTYSEVTVTVTNNTDTTISDWEIKVDFPHDTVLSANYSNSNVTITNSSTVVNSVNRYYGYNNINPGESYTFSFNVFSSSPVSSFGGIGQSTNEDDNVVSEGNPINITNLYGGNNQGGKTSVSKIDLSYGTYGNIFGGGNNALVDYTYVNLDSINSTNIYGGGNLANVLYNTSVNVSNSNNLQDIYGGGNRADVLGNSSVVLSGNMNVSHNVFAGGNAGNIGREEVDNALSKLVITGGVIQGNVYGGCNTAKVFGQTVTNIGYNESNLASLQRGDIIINGTVFGGGEANASGSEIFDFEFISVTESIDININGLNYVENGYRFELNGSIFGSGNASQTSGTSNIYVGKLGTLANPSRNISIQRTDKVILDNSVIELSGTTDRTNEYSNKKYSLNRIDQIVLKNDSSILLQENANLLKSFKSCVDVNGNEVIASVNIDDNGNVTKNVDNRVYLKSGTILNVTTNESATSYGKVTGMSFMGMYNLYSNGNIGYGLYDKNIDSSSTVDASDMIIGGSYVLGLHARNHDITVDGFYTNYINDDLDGVDVKYIDPTPPDAEHYMWVVGISVINYDVDLVAAKYSSLGTAATKLIDFSTGDTEFDILGFNVEGLDHDAVLVDPNSVPRFSPDANVVNNTFGIALKTETSEWTSYGTSKLLSRDNGTVVGDLNYKTGSENISPTFMFYFYHAKNISIDKDMGSVILTLQAKTPRNEIEYDIELITITMNLSCRQYDIEDAYDASITYGKKYDIPSATDVHITNRSQFTAYYSLYATDVPNFYGRNNDYHRALVSNFVLPVGTTITMLDLGSDIDNPKYYYYKVNNASYNQSVTEFNTNNEVTYSLSNFVKMDSISNNNTYNDLIENVNYTHESDTIFEEFIFIVDFKDTTFTGEYLDKSLMFELRNREERAIVTVLGIRQNLMKYNLYDETNAVLDQINTTDNLFINYNLDKSFNFSTNILYNETANKVKVIDTNYESSKMGINVTLRDASNNQVSSQLLSGAYIKIGNDVYHTDSNGVFRIKLADKLSMINRNIIFNTSKSLPAGNYTMTFTLFVSSDGLHRSNDLQVSEVSFNVVVVSSDNYIHVTLPDEMKLVDGVTSKNELGNNKLNFNVKCNSNLINPNLRVSVYKRDVSTYNTTVYEEYNLREFVTNTVSFPSALGYQSGSPFEFFALNNPSTNNTISYELINGLTSGTYKFVFRLYDGDYLVDEDFEYVIVEK